MTINGDGQSGPAEPRAQDAAGIKPPRNRTKALVRKDTRDGRAVVVKDFSRCSAVVRLLYGRPSLRREARAYEVLRGVPGIPEGFGLEGRDRLVVEYVPGRLLAGLKRGSVAPEVFDRVDEIVARVHERGVALGDLHASNIIITETGEVFLIDFANALFARDSRRPGPLVRFFMQLDTYAAKRRRARYLRLPSPEPVGLFGALYRFGRGVKAIFDKVKKH
jgi:RIO-like serine/threonine protein kinase